MGAQEQEKNEVVKMRAENVNALSVVLRIVLGTKAANRNEDSEQGRVQEKKHVLVLDRIDKQRELTPILLAGLGRLGEIVGKPLPSHRNYTNRLTRYPP